ncbi:zinc finger and BTB domain-containing protein 46 [Trichonephila clavipes]|nr:zinc finger and BTB domain-containing protein 46 [Trichonephila clavipes]
MEVAFVLLLNSSKFWNGTSKDNIGVQCYEENQICNIYLEEICLKIPSWEVLFVVLQMQSAGPFSEWKESARFDKEVHSPAYLIDNKKLKHCTICKYSTTLTCNMKSHIRKHTGERPFSCSICGRRFIQHSNLKRFLPTSRK